MNQFKYDELETKTETYKSYILIIHIEGEPEWRYVAKNNKKNFTIKQIGDAIFVFLERMRFDPAKTNYSIKIHTYISSTVTTIITESIFKNPYVKEKEK